MDKNELCLMKIKIVVKLQFSFFNRLYSVQITFKPALFEQTVKVGTVFTATDI